MRCCGSRHAAGQHVTSHNHKAAVAQAPGRQHQQQYAAAWGLAQPLETLNATPRAALVARIQQQHCVHTRTAVVACVSNGAPPSASTATTVSSPSSSSSLEAAAAAATGLGSDSSHSDSSSGGSEAGASKQQQEQDASNTWEEEIEETLKLVQLLPPSGDRVFLWGVCVCLWG